MTSPRHAQFSAHSVWKLLQQARKQGSKALPGKDDAIYASVARIITRLQHLWSNERGEALEKKQNREKIIAAIATIVELLPLTRADLEAELFVASDGTNVEPTDCVRAYVENTRRALSAHDALTAAATEAQKHGLPFADIDSLAPRIQTESDLIDKLEPILRSGLPSVGARERNEFIASVIRQTTGKVLTSEQVRDRVRKRTPVNMGK